MSPFLLVLSVLVLYLTGHISAVPIGSLTERSPKVLGLDFEVESLHSDTKRRRTDTPMSLNNQGLYYIAYLEFGSDKQKVGLDIDTGSSDTWVPAVNVTKLPTGRFGTFNSSSSVTYNDLGKEFKIKYGGQESASGTFGTDTVTIGSASINNFQFACIEKPPQAGGILGLGMPANEADIKTEGEYDNFPIALKKAGYIDKAAYSVYLNAPQASGGSILFGGKDTAKIDGKLYTFQHAGDSGALEIELDFMSFGNETVEVNYPMLLDTGSAYSFLPFNILKELLTKLGGNGVLNKNGLINVPCQTEGNFIFHFGNLEIDIPLSELVVTESDGKCVLNIYGGGRLLGDNFLRHAYLVYNVEDGSIQVGKVRYTDESNIAPL